MLSTAAQRGPDPLLELSAYAEGLETWLASRPTEIRDVAAPIPVYERRVEAMSRLMEALHAQGWARYGWPTWAGGPCSARRRR